jgi:hypothetical protein
MYTRTLIPELEDIIHETPLQAELLVNPKKVNCADFTEALRNKLPKGVTDPVKHLETIVKRAVGLMTNTIDELVRVQGRVRADSRIATRDQVIRVFNDPTFATSLEKRMNINVGSRASWMGDKPGMVGLVIRWLKNIRDLLRSGDLRYTCVSHHRLCNGTSFAWTIRPTPAAIKRHFDFFHIRLCEAFWNPTVPTDDDTLFISQVQTLIHETSHIYYASVDNPGVGPWVAECINTFIVETNGILPDPDFEGRCGLNP